MYRAYKMKELCDFGKKYFNLVQWLSIKSTKLQI